MADSEAGKKGVLATVGGALKTGVSYVPSPRAWNPLRRERLEKAEEESERKKERVRADERKKLEGKKEEQAAHRIAPNIDREATEGGDLDLFNNKLLDALRRGQSRTRHMDVADAMIREVFTDAVFIMAIQSHDAVKTPLEEIDEEYAKEMKQRRARLAEELNRARTHKEYMIGKLSAHELDIIYVTAIGKIDLWEKQRWPEGKVKPHIAFFKFLESIAIREKNETKGEFIGMTLKYLSTKHTLTDSKEECERTLVDTGYINEYLYSRSAAPIDAAVESFHSIMSSLLATPTREMHPTVNVPGLGYNEHYPKALAEKKAWAEQMRPQYDKAKAAFDVAERVHNEVEDLCARVKKEGSVKLDNGEVITKKDAKKDGRLDKALQKAENDLKAARAVLDPVEREYRNRVDEVQRFEAEAKPEAFAKELSDHFRQRLEENRDSNVELSNVGEAMARRLPNIAVTKLLDKATELSDSMEEAALHFHPVMANKEQFDRVHDEVMKLLAGSLTDYSEAMVVKRVKEVVELIKGSPFASREFMQRMRAEIDSAGLSDGSKKLLADHLESVEMILYGKMDDSTKIVLERKPETYEDRRLASEWALKMTFRDYVHETQVFSYKKDEFEKRMKEFGQDIEAAVLPEEVKIRLRAVHKCMGSLTYSKSDIHNMIGKIANSYAFPLRKVVPLAVKDLKEKNYRNLAGLTEGEKVVARMVYEARRDKVESDQALSESKWTKFWKTVNWHLFTRESWLSRDLHHPGKLVWLWRKTIGQDVDDLVGYHPFKRSNWKEKRKIKVRGKRERLSKVPRWVDGAWGFFWKTYVIGVPLVGHLLTTPPLEHWYSYLWPLNWGRPVTLIAEEINGGRPIILPESHDRWYFTWSWTMPIEGEREDILIVHDTYDDPARLHERSDDFYRGEFGVGRRLEGETTDEGARRRLSWLRDHRDVLRFFMERRTLRQDVRVETLQRNPQTCWNTQSQFPQSCRDLGVNSMEAAASYQPVNRGGWEPGEMVCCTIRRHSTPVRDGLKLNTYMSDRFIDMLMVQEAGGTRITYQFLTGAANRGRWVQEWFLYTLPEDQIVHQFGIHERDNVRFLLVNGPRSQVENGATGIILPRCERARETEFLLPDHRDEFVRAWREEIVRSQAEAAPPVTVDPLTQQIPQQVLLQAFGTVKDAHPQWFEDVTQEYNRRVTREELVRGGLHPQMDATLDMLIERPEMMEVVRLYLPAGAMYHLEDTRFDEFVMNLYNHRRMGGSADDYNAFLEAGPGPMVHSAIGYGFIIQNAPQPAQSAEGGTQAQAAPVQSAAPVVTAVPQAPVRATIPDLSAEASRFYARQENIGFKDFLEGVTGGLFDDERDDGRVMAAVLASRFGGQRDRMERAIRQNVYAFVSSTTGPDAAQRNSYGLTISGEGAQLTVSVEDANSRRARTSLKTHIIRFVRGLQTR
jgi:hypothetical protein